MSVTEGDSFFLSLHLSFVGFQLHDFGTSWGKQERTMCHWVIVLKSSQYHSSSFWIQDGNYSLVHTVAFQQTHTRKALAGVPFLLSVFLAALEDSAEILPCLCKVGLWTLVSPSHSAAFSVLYQQCGLVILYKRQSSRQVIEGRDGWMDGSHARVGYVVGSWAVLAGCAYTQCVANMSVPRRFHWRELKSRGSLVSFQVRQQLSRRLKDQNFGHRQLKCSWMQLLVLRKRLVWICISDVHLKKGVFSSE